MLTPSEGLEFILNSDESSYSATGIGACTDFDVVIPNTYVISIGEDAFRNCYKLTIYCEATSKPSGCDSSWNSSKHPVYWYIEAEPTTDGNYWHYGENDEIVVW